MPSPVSSSATDGDGNAATDAGADADTIDEAPRAVTPLGRVVRAVAHFLWRRWVRVAWLTALLAGGLVWFSLWWMEIRPFGKQYPGPVYPAMAMVDGKPRWGAIDDTGRWELPPRQDEYQIYRWSLQLTSYDRKYQFTAKWPFYQQVRAGERYYYWNARLRRHPNFSSSLDDYSESDWVTRSSNRRVQWAPCFDRMNQPDALLVRSVKDLGWLIHIESEKSLRCSKALQVREVDPERERNDLALVMEMTGPRLIRIGNDDFHELATFPDPLTLEGVPAPRPRNLKTLEHGELLRLADVETRMAEGLILVHYVDVRKHFTRPPNAPPLAPDHYGLRRLDGEWLVPVGPDRIEALEEGFLVWADAEERTQLRQLRAPNGTLLATDIAAADWRTAATTAGRRHLLRDAATGRWQLLDATGTALTEAVFVDPLPSRFVLLDRIAVPSTPSADGAKQVAAGAFNGTIPSINFLNIPRPDVTYRLYDPHGASLGKTLKAIGYVSLDGTLLASQPKTPTLYGLLSPAGEWLIEPQYEVVHAMSGTYEMALDTIDDLADERFNERDIGPVPVAVQRAWLNSLALGDLASRIRNRDDQYGFWRTKDGPPLLPPRGTYTSGDPVGWYPDDRPARPERRIASPWLPESVLLEPSFGPRTPGSRWFLVEQLQATGSPIALGPLVVHKDGKLGLLSPTLKRLIVPVAYSFLRIDAECVMATHATRRTLSPFDGTSWYETVKDASGDTERAPATAVWDFFRLDGTPLAIPGLEALGRATGGYRPFRANGLMGLLNGAGEIVLPPRFAFIGSIGYSPQQALLVVEAPADPTQPRDASLFPKVDNLSVSRTTGQLAMGAFDTVTGKLSPMDCDGLHFYDEKPLDTDGPTFRVLFGHGETWQPMGPDGAPFGPPAASFLLNASQAYRRPRLLEPPSWTEDPAMPVLLTIRGAPSVMREECKDGKVSHRASARYWMVYEPAPSKGVFYVDRFGQRLVSPAAKAE